MKRSSLLLLFFLIFGHAWADLPQQSSSGWFSSVKPDFLGGGSKFMRPEEAFKLRVEPVDGHTLAADFEPAPGYYLYKARIEFELQDALGLKLARVNLPQGELKNDQNLGKTEVYHKPFRAAIDLSRDKASGGKLVLLATYQGCSEQGLCYSPITSRYELQLPAVDAVRAVAAGSESARIDHLFQTGNFWLIVASFLGFGLLMSLTPCVFPMVPILSGIIVGHGEHLTRARGLILSSVYVLGLAMVYAAAGVFAGFTGDLVSNALQNPYALGGFSLIFVLLALSMFGLYELQLPVFLQSKLSDASNRLQGGHVTGVFLMGALSAVIVGPCCAAPLAGALLYLGKTHDVLLGGSALFAMGLGMGLPLIAVGVSAGSVLPRAGAWMQSVKNFFGVLLLALAIWEISPLIPAVAGMLLWSALLIVSAIYLHAIDPLPPHASGFRKLWKGVGVISLLVGTAFLIGALSGGRDLLQPLSGLRAAAATGGDSLHFEGVKTLAELDSRIKQAKGRPVMLDFYADWCVSCKEMERFTFSDPRVRQQLSNAVLLRADVTANSGDDLALLKRFNLFGPPGIVFFDAQGNELADSRVVGAQDAEAFLATLNSRAS